MQQVGRPRGVFDDAIGKDFYRVSAQKIRVDSPSGAKSAGPIDLRFRLFLAGFQRKRGAYAHVQPVRIVKGLVNLHVMFVNRGVLHGRDAGCVHGVECACELRCLEIHAMRRPGSQHHVGSIVAQGPGRVALRVPLDVAALERTAPEQSQSELALRARGPPGQSSLL